MNHHHALGLALCAAAGLALCSVTLPALAANNDCQTGTPEGERACITPDLKDVEKALERQIYQLDKHLHAAQRTRRTRARQYLGSSQKHWLRYRDDFCALEGLASAGTGPWLPVRTLECRMRMTKDRLEFLRDVDATLEEPRS